MKRICYFCGRYMGEKFGNHAGEVCYSVCDECLDRLRLEERLPELLLATAELRKQTGNKESYQPIETLVPA